jgi:hypothetical protein
VNMVYSKYHGMFLWLMNQTKGGIYYGRMDGICFALSRSPQSLLRCSIAGLTCTEQCRVNGEPYSPLVNDTWTPSDNGLLAMIFLRTSSMELPNSMGSPDILTFKETGQGRRTDRWGRQTDDEV